MRKYIAPVEFQACRLGVCGGRSTQTADTRASAGLLRLEFEQFRKGYSIAAKERPRKNGEEMPEATWEPHEKHVDDLIEPGDGVTHVLCVDEDRDLAFANIQKAARHYGVNLSEGSWQDLGIHRRKRRKAPADAL